jgi:hypothetical protein
VFKRVAEAVAKDPNSTAVAAALEEYNLIPFDAQKSPKEAEEILQIYRQQVAGRGGSTPRNSRRPSAPSRPGSSAPRNETRARRRPPRPDLEVGLLGQARCKMSRFGFVALALVGLGPMFAVFGCAKKAEQGPNYDELADKKVAALKRLAEEMAKDPSGVEARGALEEFRNTPLDLQKSPKQADEIAQVYRQRIQGKYKGFVADELRAEMGQFLTRPKQGK